MKIIILSIFLLSFYCEGQTIKSGVFFETKKWTEINRYKDHYDSVWVFVTNDCIYLSIGKKKEVFKIRNLTMLSPYLFIYDCTNDKGEKYRIDYAIQLDKTFNFDIGKTKKDPDEILIQFNSWSMKNLPR